MKKRITEPCTKEERKKAQFELNNALYDLPENESHTQLHRLKYEFKKYVFYITASDGRLMIPFEGYDSGLKTVISKLLTDDNKINRPGIIKRACLLKPTEKEKKVPINKLYDIYNPGIGKTTIFDRWINNMALCMFPNGYCTKKKYDVFMKSLDKILKKYLKDGLTIKNFFLYITKDVQAQRMKERSEDPYTWDRVSHSDLNSSNTYDQILGELIKLIEIYENAGVPITVVNTEDEEIGFINILKSLLDGVKYDKKSETIDFTPDSTIVGKTKDDILKIITPTNEEVLKVMKSKNRKYL